jgi:hypothetical protein
MSRYELGRRGRRDERHLRVENTQGVPLNSEHPHEEPWIEKIDSGEPIVKKFGEVSLVGVRHTSVISSEPPFDYVKAVLTADHILLEGDRATYQGKSNNYEQFAHDLVSLARGESAVHYLEEGVADERLLVDSGMDPKLARYYSAYGLLINGLAHGWFSDQKKTEESSSILAEKLQQGSSVFAEIPTREITTELTEWVGKIDNAEDFGMTGLKVAFNYSCRLRDVCVLAPRGRELVETLPGNKSIFVGRNHLPAMEGMLRGNPSPSLLPWREHVQQLSQEDWCALRDFASLGGITIESRVGTLPKRGMIARFLQR